VRVSSCENAAPAWTAGTGGKKSIVKNNSFFGQFIDIWCFDVVIAIRTTVVPGRIIGNKNNKIGLLRFFRLRICACC
jgi:hypothetical protein